jgi:hypothetical protein
MASLSNVLLCAITATVFWTCLGLPLARHLAPERPLTLAIAPALGWAVFNAAALPILLVAGFTQSTVAILCGVALLASFAAVILMKAPEPLPKAAAGVLWWAYGAAALLALAPAMAVMPKFVGDGVLLAAPMYDHSKIAIINDIARLGLPAGNPFFGPVGASSRLAYYYLWHFGAAFFVKLLGISGWESDIALTWFSAFASLTLMMGLAVWLSGHSAAALWVLFLSVSASLRPVLVFALGPATFGGLLSSRQALQAWILQASWVPQHLASASCVVLAVFLISRITGQNSRLQCPTLALVVAAGFESSAWIGGVTFAVAAVLIGFVLLRSTEPKHRRRFVANAAIAAGLAVVIAFPFLHDEYIATAARHVGVPITLLPFEVLGPLVPDGMRRILDLPAYWLIFLVIEFPAIYLAGSMALAHAVTASDRPPIYKRPSAGLALLAGASFGIAWLFVSTIANNDLGWRAVLPGVLVLTVFAAVGLSRWLAKPVPYAAAAAIALFALGIPDGLQFIRDNVDGIRASSAATFANTPEMWEAVRRHSAPDERVGNNPLFLQDTVVWPVNISWALFADRRSCFAGWDLARAYVALPGPEIDRLEALFERVFAGDGSPDEIRSLAEKYDCRLIVVTASDGAWQRDEFAASAFYQLVEEKAGKWRIYRAKNPA